MFGGGGGGGLIIGILLYAVPLTLWLQCGWSVRVFACTNISVVISVIIRRIQSTIADVSSVLAACATCEHSPSS